MSHGRLLSVPRDADEQAGLGREMYRFIETLYPICRGIAGVGCRKTLNHINALLPIRIHETRRGRRSSTGRCPRSGISGMPGSGRPRREGDRLPEIQSPCRQLQHPDHRTMPLEQSAEAPHDTRPPGWIPYRTTYYQEDWGFCIAYNDLNRLEDGDYEVFIDSHSIRDPYRRRILPARPAVRGSPLLLSCLPPFALQR